MINSFPVIALTCALIFILPAAYSDKRPDVLLISIDTLRADHLSNYGYTRPTSPNIARFSEQSVQFDDCITSVPLTLPAHVSMLTGLHPAEHSVATNGLKAPDQLFFLSEILQENGYETFGAVTSQILREMSNINQGFDQYTAFLSGDKTERSNAPTDAFINWLEKRDSTKPYFAFVHYIDVHSPYGGIEPYVNYFDEDKSDRKIFHIEEHVPPLIAEWKAHGKYISDPGLKRFIAKYDDGVIAVDHQIGRIMGALKDRGKFENTLVVLTADHGEGLGDGKADFNHGDAVYQSTLHVPLIIHFPTPTRSGLRSAFPATLMDIAPTILDVVSVTQNQPMPLGVTLKPVLEGALDEQAIRSRCASSHTGMGLNFRRAILQSRFKQMRDEWNPGNEWWAMKIDADLREADILSVEVKSDRIFQLQAVISTGRRLVTIPMQTAAKVANLASDWAQTDRGQWQDLKTPYIKRFVDDDEEDSLQLVRLELNTGQSSRFKCYFETIGIMVDSKFKIIESFEGENAPQWVHIPSTNNTTDYEHRLLHNECTRDEVQDGIQSQFLELEYIRHPFVYPLFDLSTDPGEGKDISAGHQELSKGLLYTLDLFYKGASEMSLQERSEEAKEMLRALGYLDN